MNAIQQVPNEAIAKREAIMRAMGIAANESAARAAAGDVERRKAKNTITAHGNDLALFSRYLESVAGIDMPNGETLRTDPSAWVGVTWGIVAGFVRWMEGEGFAVASINRALSTVKGYGKVAAKAKVISTDEAFLIAAVRGYGAKEGKELDKGRSSAGAPVRRSHVADRESHRGVKAAEPVALTKEQATALRAQPDTPQGRRDALLMCLLLDHGLRESEVAALTVEGVNLTENTITFERQKTGKTETQEMTPATRKAMRAWFDSGDVPAIGTLLRGSRKGGRLTGQLTEESATSAIRQRVRMLGESIGAKGLSPHDCRHYWATAIARMASKGKVTILQLQEMGGWSSLAMPRRYVDRLKVANAGVDYSDL